jgi:hypothetical protein
MDLKLRRNEQNVYELHYNDIVLGQAGELAELIERAEKYAKRFQKKLFISQAALADWYVGFPLNRDTSPEVFFDPHYQIRTQVESQNKDATPSPYRFVEGPFLTQQAAVEAAFKISGKPANLVGKE